MKALKDKNIVLGVTGGIAIYKALDVVSKLKKLGANIDVIMTKNATKFVTPLTFESMSQNKVISDMFEKVVYWDIEHISLAKKADIFAIIPATANVVGKIANGIADDMLTTTVMATNAKVLIAPAMNTNMYNNPIYKLNEEKLKKFGYDFIKPGSGRLACGDKGDGKLASSKKIVKKIKYNLLKTNELEGKKVLVTAGPTIEKIDPVRYITNHSSGKMGYEVAKAAKIKGAEVTLITGPSNIEKPDVNVINVTSADEMYKEAIKYIDYDVVIMAAAVSDYKPKNKFNNKVKKSNDNMILELKRNKDILFEFGKNKEDQILVGFAAESNNLEEYAIKKINDKNLDFIVANNITNKEAGFKSDNNKALIIDNNNRKKYYDLMKKSKLAKIIIDKVIQLEE
ncbi:MAG: bifunctional phosphopantothenoylcysteine decarboxylase/phosphopantothenate--cysteine ligase CoaBC [Bacillota bacterium]